MRPVRLASLFAASLIIPAVAACGSDAADEPDASLVLVDAPLPPDAAPPPDAEPCLDTVCDGVCIDTDTSETACGDCTTVCNGGETCAMGTCECPDPFVPASPTFAFNQIITQIPGTIAGLGIYGDPNTVGVADALIAGHPATGTVVGMEYTLTDEALGTPPLLAAGYNVDVQTMQFDAAYYATAGTIVFDTICQGGFSGHATNVTFSAVEGIQNPTIDPDGCTFTVETVTFAYGTACPTE